MNSFQSYNDCIDWLFKQFPSYQKIGLKAYKPTLENTIHLLEAFNHPEKELKFIHVAGSNGKGSVCTYLASLATESGYKTGLFTSPHILDFRERIRINGQMITEEAVLDFVNKVRSLSLDFSPSFFEITLVMALEFFKEEKCDIVVLETGLGGRLDATNVITPEISIITSISLEHQNILGDTISEIATEKAGIIKQEIPVVTGKLLPEAISAIRFVAKNKNATLSEYSEIHEANISDSIQLATDYQRVNLSTANKAVDVLNKRGWHFDTEQWPVAIKHLKQNTGFFGRFEIRQTTPLIIWDVSHNADGITETLSSFRSMFDGQMNIMIGLSADKNIDAIVDILPVSANLFVTTFQSERSAELSQLKAAFARKNFSSISYFSDPQEALKSAEYNLMQNDGLIVLGSFFLFEKLF